MTTALSETRHDYEVIDGIITFDIHTGEFVVCKGKEAVIGSGEYLLFEGKIRIPIIIRD